MRRAAPPYPPHASSRSPRGSKRHRSPWRCAAFIDWVAAYTLAAPGEVLAMALRVNALSPPVPTPGWQLAPASPDTKLTEPRRRVLALMADFVPRIAPDIARLAGVSAGVLRGMAEAGLLTRVPIPAGRAFAEPDPAFAAPALSPKLLAVLLARYEAFAGAADKGLVIVPTELIPNNGTKLHGILRELAENQVPDPGFLHWLETANTVCNSLVDRIVPGAPAAAAATSLTQKLGYDDELLLMSEVYRLWAIEGSERVREILSFEQADAGIIVQPDINQFRELKLRLLNGTHSLACGLAVLGGVGTVREAMEDDHLLTYIRNLMLADLLPGIPYPLGDGVGQRFGMQVLDRFRNPAVEHRWLAITLNYSAKLRMRVVPDLLHYYQRFGAVPQYVALGFAAYLLFMRGVRQEDGRWLGEAQGQEYLIQDEHAGFFADLWVRCPLPELVRQALSDTGLWDTDLTALPGFTEAVTHYLGQLQLEGAAATLANMLNKNQRAAV